MSIVAPHTYLTSEQVAAIRLEADGVNSGLAASVRALADELAFIQANHPLWCAACRGGSGEGFNSSEGAVCPFCDGRDMVNWDNGQ